MVGARVPLEAVEGISKAVKEDFHLTPFHLTRNARVRKIDWR
jgi:hypothetical protein